MKAGNTMKDGGFVCRRCGACCRVKDGIVRVSEKEIARIAAFLGVGVQDFIADETELAPDRKSLVLKSRPDGSCAYLTADNLCRINPVKPTKCRTFPFAWSNPDSAEVCPALASCRSYTFVYRTPRGFSDMVMMSDGEKLTGLHFAGARRGQEGACGARRNLPVFRETCRWLDVYFGGHQPDFMPPYRIDGLTPFREAVMVALRKIPFGATVTYGDMAAEIGMRRGLRKMSAQAVGGAVGWNPLCLIFPCHRVVGAKGALVGYGGGFRNKAALLAHEGASAGASS